MSHLPEDQVVYLAMRDMNIARLTSDDLPLFNGIMSDIFPGVTLPVVDYLDMNSAITEYMEENNLQVFILNPFYVCLYNNEIILADSDCPYQSYTAVRNEKFQTFGYDSGENRHRQNSNVEGVKRCF